MQAACFVARAPHDVCGIICGIVRLPDLLAVAHDEKAGTSLRARVDEAVSIVLAVAYDEKADTSVRERAVETAQALARQVCDEMVNEWVRERVASALGQFGDVRILPELERIAHEDRSEPVRRTAQWAVEQIRERAAHDHADTRTTPRVRIEFACGF